MQNVFEKCTKIICQTYDDETCWVYCLAYLICQVPTLIHIKLNVCFKAYYEYV